MEMANLIGPIDIHMKAKKQKKVKKRLSNEHWSRLKTYKGPPYSYKVRVNGVDRIMSGFDEEHISNQLHPRKLTLIKRLKDI